MPILKIARMGHPVLRNPAKPVEDPTSADIKRLVDDMIETMKDAGGVGLAAPQVHIPLRLVVFYVPRGRDKDAPEGEGMDLTVLINPCITPLDEEKEESFEGCLSLPAMTGKVSRYKNIRYSYTTLEGKQVEREATGFHARVVQHECDHLDGILYPQRMDDLSTLGYVEEMQKPLKQDE